MPPILGTCTDADQHWSYLQNHTATLSVNVRIIAAGVTGYPTAPLESSTLDRQSSFPVTSYSWPDCT